MCILFFKRFIYIVLKHYYPVIKKHIFRIGRVTAICGWLLLLLLAENSPIFSQWVRHGPGPNTNGQVENITDQEVVGAIHAVAPHPTNANILYVGAVNGGIWKTINALAVSPTWECQTNFQESLSIGALEFDPSDATNQSLLAGIGRFSAMGRRGGERTGLLRTTDGGANWNPIDGGGTLTGLNISGVAPRGNTIVISVNTADNSANSGIWRSTDTGASWTQISGSTGTGLPSGASYDLTSDPGDPNRLFTNAGANGVYRSTDMGANWTKVSDAAMDALITGSTENIEIAVGTSNNVFVAIVNDVGANKERLVGLFRSGDGGATWTSLDLPATIEDGGVSFGIHPGGQGNIHLSITADPTNSNIVYVGGDRQPYFTEGTTGLSPYFPTSINAFDFSGRLFRVDASQPAGSQAVHLTHSNTMGPAGGGTASSSAPHADSRDMAFAANGDLIEVDDGGVYRRTSPQTNTGDWFSMNGDIQVTEFHDVAWDANSKIVIGGTQDTGTPEQLLPSNVRWESVSTADGGDVDVDDTSTPGLSVRYSSNQYLGRFRRREYNTANEFQSQVFPALTVVGGGAGLLTQFYTPIQLNMVDPFRLIIGGGNSVYESLDQGDTITEIGPGVRVNSLGRDPIAYGAVGNPNILYVGDGSQVFVRTAAHPAPLTASATYPGGLVVDIAINPGDPQTAYVIDEDNVYQTIDAAATWTDITGDLQTLNPGDLWSIAYSTSNTDGSVAVGSDNGVFIARGPNFTTWSQLGTNLPAAPVYDLEYDSTDEILLAGTLGRGAWTFNLAEREPIDVMLVLDISGSMQNVACPTCDPKLNVLKDAVEIFIKLWTALAVTDDRLGVTYFRTNIDELDVGGMVLLPVIDNASAMIEDVQAQTTNWTNKTAMGGGLQSAINRLVDDTRPRNIILFTNGMQNVNPKVLKIDDSPPPGAFHLEIDHHPSELDYSDVEPTVPPTELDEALGIKVNTIGIGAATAYYIDLLEKIATKTGGLFKHTTAPDDELRRFYVEDLIEVLRDYSPQLLAYRYGNLSVAMANETFTVNNSARRVILKLSWKRGDNMSFQVEKDGVDVTYYGHIINGPFYRIFHIDVPAEVQGKTISADGDWIMRICGQQGAAYEAVAIVDEPGLEYEFSLGQNDYVVGDPLQLSVQLTYRGHPVTDAQVTAQILKPQQGLGTLLSINSTPSEPPGFKYESGVTAAQRKLQLLLRDNTFYRALQPVKQPLTFQNNGDGSYSASFDTDLTGTYSVIFQVKGERFDIGAYERTEVRSTMVRFGQAVLDASDLYKTLIKETADGRQYRLQVRPIDRFWNYLGPDYGHMINVLKDGNPVNDALKDQLDGSYTIQLFVPPTADPTVSVTVMGEPLFKGPLSAIPSHRKPRFALSMHAGMTLPLSDFAKAFDPGFLAEVDLEYFINQSMSLEGVLGRYTFKPDYVIIGGTLYLKGYLPLNGWQLFGALGPGLYKPENIDAAFGISLGTGINKSLSQHWQSEIGAYYFHLFTSGDDIDFIGLKVGLRYSF